MLDVYNCLTIDHDWRLVALAVVICILASSVAISLFHRAQGAHGRTRLIWISLEAAAAGCGIWATHFIAMLAYAPAVGIGYNLSLTILSLLIAMLIPGAGFGLALVGTGRLPSAIGGAMVGIGIAAMHYTGMAALELWGGIVWAPHLLVASVAYGVVFGAAAVAFAVRGDDWKNAACAVVLLTLAIAALHFTAMAAVVVMPYPDISPANLSMSPTSFSLVVAGATTIILGMCLVAALSDRRWTGTLRRQRLLLDTAIENMSQGLAMFDANGRVTLYNARYAEMIGLPPIPLKGRSLLDLLKQRKASGHFTDDPEDHFARVMANMREGNASSRHVQIGERTLRIVDVPMPHGGWVATFEDITEWLLTQAQISHMAHHDPLTDLANRTLMIERLADVLTASDGQGGSAALYFIDLDRFKNVNDTLGHDAGDLLLKTVAERLRAATGADDIVARLGGDEFVVAQAGATSKADAEAFAHRLLGAIAVPMKLGDQTVAASISVGVALAPDDADNPERLLKCADLAMYKAKAEGRNRVRVFRPEMDAELQSRTTLERMIREAIDSDGFVLHYQPVIDLAEKRIVGFEALIRLPRPDGTLVPPVEFISLAEDLGLIDKIGTWVLREACRTAATWPQDLTIAVNLSPAQFLSGSISATVADALRASGLAAHRLELEITENLLLGDSEAIIAELERLKASGVSIVMDDFGTGYSSLGYLWKFSFDKIKIDRSFMKGLDADNGAETVVKTIIALGRELRMRVTVEGVETARQAALLEKMEGTLAQGYFFSRPVPQAEIAAVLLMNFRQRELPADVAIARPRLVKSAAAV